MVENSMRFWHVWIDSARFLFSIPVTLDVFVRFIIFPIAIFFFFFASKTCNKKTSLNLTVKQFNNRFLLQTQ